MCEENGDFREGLSSNFFIIKDNFEVQTANEGILDGTVKQLISKIALEDYVHVICNNIEMKLEYKIPFLRSLSSSEMNLLPPSHCWQLKLFDTIKKMLNLITKHKQEDLA
jgi:hypothetical protein